MKLFHESKRRCFATWQRILTNITVIISLPWNTYKKCLECAFPPGIFHLFFTDIYNYYSLSKFCDLLTKNWNITLLLTEDGKSLQTHWWFWTFRGVPLISLRLGFQRHFLLCISRLKMDLKMSLVVQSQ